jgi:hypothetical protein
MFTINEDLSIYATRGDTVFFTVTAEENGVPCYFEAGDVLRIKVFQKKNANNVVLEKCFPVEAKTDRFTILLTEEDTKIGEVISKATDYWYEIELNPFTNPQTIIGYDEDGAKVFRLFPEGKDSEIPEVDPEDIPVVDVELDMTSPRPVQNQAIARAIVNLADAIRTAEIEAGAKVTDVSNALTSIISDIAVERERIDNIVALEEGSTTGDAELSDIRVTYDGETYENAGKALRVQFQRIGRYGHFVSSSSNAVSFDTAAKTVRIEKGFVLYREVRYETQATTLDYSAAGSTSFAVYNKSSKKLECINYANYDSKIHIALFSFLPSTLNEVRKSNVYGLESYRVNGYLVNGENNFVRKGLFVVRNSVGLAFDTLNNTVSVPNEAYLFYGENRYDITGASCEIPTTGSTQKHIVFNTQTNGIECVTYTEYLYYKHIIICTFTYKDMGTPYSNDIPCGYSVNGVLYSKYGSVAEVGGVTSAHVSTNGDDDNVGSAEAPFRTIQKALNSGANKIVVAGGVYPEVLSVSDRASLTIIGGWDGSFDGNIAPVKDKVIIECGERVVFTDGENVLKAGYESTEADYIHKVFVSKELDVDDGGNRSKGYYVNLWKKLGIGRDVKLTPVLTLSDCQSVEDSWFYDGSTIYANTSNDGDFVLASGKVSGSAFTNINELTIEDVVFAHAPNSNVTLNKCNQVTLRNCEFNYSSLGQGLRMEYSNGVIENCKAYYNRNDGYNFHGYGDTTLNNCIASYNFDDGASHHDGCTASFVGGEYAHNGKGGIAPAHGAVANIHDVISHHNEYGFYVESDGTFPASLGRKVRLVGCVAYSNNYGLSARNYHLTSYNCKFTDNETPILIRTANEHTSHTVL